MNPNKIRRPRLQQGERVRGEITSSKGQEVITSSTGQEARSKKQEAIASSKGQEASSKKSGSKKKKKKKKKKKNLQGCNLDLELV